MVKITSQLLLLVFHDLKTSLCKFFYCFGGKTDILSKICRKQFATLLPSLSGSFQCVFATLSYVHISYLIRRRSFEKQQSSTPPYCWWVVPSSSIPTLRISGGYQSSIVTSSRQSIGVVGRTVCKLLVEAPTMAWWSYWSNSEGKWIWASLCRVGLRSNYFF